MNYSICCRSQPSGSLVCDLDPLDDAEVQIWQKMYLETRIQSKGGAKEEIFLKIILIPDLAHMQSSQIKYASHKTCSKGKGLA